MASLRLYVVASSIKVFLFHVSLITVKKNQFPFISAKKKLIDTTQSTMHVVVSLILIQSNSTNKLNKKLQSISNEERISQYLVQLFYHPFLLEDISYLLALLICPEHVNNISCGHKCSLRGVLMSHRRCSVVISPR